MMANTIKCLFGYHDYGEVWTVNGSIYEGRFYLCSGCHSVAQYTIGWATKEDKPITVKVLANKGCYLDIESSSREWRFMKKSNGILDTGVRMDNVK